MATSRTFSLFYCQNRSGSLTSIIQPKVKRSSKPSQTISRTASHLLRMRKKLSRCSQLYLNFQRIAFVTWTCILRISFAVTIPYQIGFNCDNDLPSASELAANYLFDACWFVLVCAYCSSKAQKSDDNRSLLCWGAVAVLPLEALTLVIGLYFHRCITFYDLTNSFITLHYRLRDRWTDSRSIGCLIAVTKPAALINVTRTTLFPNLSTVCLYQPFRC